MRERELRHELVTLDAQATTAAAEMASRKEEMLASTLGTLQGLAERARGTSSVIQERERALRQALIASADENVIATLEADAARLEQDLDALRAEESHWANCATVRRITRAIRAAEASVNELGALDRTGRGGVASGARTDRAARAIPRLR